MSTVEFTRPERQFSHPEPVEPLGAEQGAKRDWRSQESREEYRGCRVIQFSGRFYAVPMILGPISLADPAQCAHPWIFSALSSDRLREEIKRRAAGGHLPQQIESFEGFEIFACGGSYYAVRGAGSGEFLGPPQAATSNDPQANVFVDRSVCALRQQILRANGVDLAGEVVGTYCGYGLTVLNGNVMAVPRGLQGAENLSKDEQIANGVVQGKSRAEVEETIRRQPPPREIQFAGWLPAFQRFGNCGAHPQFGHVELPPAGYAFVQTPPAQWPATGFNRWKRLAGKGARHFKVRSAMARLGARCLAKGLSYRQTREFLESRDIPSQLALPRCNRLLFMTSVPFTFGQDPWVIEIEDLVSLLFPFLHNGQTVGLDVERRPEFRAVKMLLEGRNCRGVLTHIRSTAEGITGLFQSATISKKTTYLPMGVRTPLEWQRHEPSATINLLFTNSWHQATSSFYLRGGLDVLEAFSKLRPAYPELRLTLRTKLPADLPPRYQAIIQKCRINVLDEFLPAEQLEQLLLSSHVHVLPSARVHIMSVLQAMSYGLVPIVSDGWGMTEYVDHRKTGLVIQGRYGKVSWNDEKNGMLREDYSSMYRADPQVTQRLIDSISQVADVRTLRRELGQNARAEVMTRFNISRWNMGLKRFLDRAWEG